MVALPWWTYTTYYYISRVKKTECLRTNIDGGWRREYVETRISDVLGAQRGHRVRRVLSHHVQARVHQAGGHALR